MVAIENNPTHIETALSEERVAYSEGAENRLDGIIPKKNRKKDGLGAFSKLLAGLVNKKPLKQGENSLKIGQDGQIPGDNAEGGAKKTGFPRLTEAKGLKAPKENLAAVRENRQRGTAQDQGLEGILPLNFEFARLFPADVRDKQPFTMENVSFKADNSRQAKDSAERRVPYKKGEAPELYTQAESQKASLQSARSTAGKPQHMESDTKKAGKKRNTFSVDIQDQRTQTGAEAGAIAERGLKGAEETRSRPESEIAVELRADRARGEKPPEAGQKAPAGESFEQMLARELRGDLSADIVRQAAIVLRDGGEGTIKLSLKPETLGKVKIHLEMAENRISGHIFVENEEALRAFEQEIHTLEQSFRDSGFEASLNAALDYQDGGQRWKEKEIIPFYSERFAVTYEESSAMEYSTGFGFSAVNVLA
jgi:hypothetical protein